MNMGIMKRMGLVGASVCVVLLAASAAAPSLAGAAEITKATEASALVHAYAALEKGQARKAIQLYDRLINARKLSPELLARALLNRGLAHQKLGANANAVRDYDAALRIDALSAKARVTTLYNRALALRAMGDAGRAIEDLTAALYIDPAFAPAYFARGNILHESGLYYLALADYDQALAYEHPKKWRVHYARALLYSALNSLRHTKNELYAALREKPDFEPARKRLSAILTGKLPKTRLFADLVKKRRAGKRIAARITPASGTGMFKTATVMIAGAPVLNLRKTPQATPVSPVMALAQARKPGKDETKTAAGMRKYATKPTTTQRKPWRVASLKVVAPAAKRTAPRRTAERRATMIRTASISTAAGEMKHAERKAAQASSSDETRALQTQKTVFAGWAIQLSSQRSEDAAMTAWNKMERKVRHRVRAGKMAVMRAELPGRGTYYRLRLVGFPDRATAKRHCRQLKRDRISCIVVRAGS